VSCSRLRRASWSIAVLLLAACSSSGDEAPPAEATPAAAGEADIHAATPPPPSVEAEDPCGFADDAAAAWTKGAEARATLGEFGVDFTGGALRVTHGKAERVVYASPADRLLEAAKTDLRAEEHQGSFEIEEHDLATCARPVVSEESTSNGKLRLRGTFADAEPACRALSFTVGMCEARPGHLAIDVKLSDPSFGAVTLRAASDPGERFYGLGEQFRHDTLDLKGRRIRVLSSEGGVGRGHQPISGAMNLASKGSAGAEDTTYYAAPHVTTNRMRSLFVENTELSVFDMTAPDALAVKTYAPHVRARVLGGESPLELLERFTEYSGRMPPLPDWVGEGAIVAIARDTNASLVLVDKMRAAGVPIAAVWNQTWPGKAHTIIGEQVLWNWAYNPRFHPGWNAYVDALEQRGIKTLCYVNSMFRPVPDEAKPVSRDTFAEGLGLDAFVKGPGGDTLMMPVTAFDVALLDVTKPDARSWMKRLIKEEMIDKARCSGWMADFGEALPFDARVASGAQGSAAHNSYPVEWMRINREVLDDHGLVGKVLVWNRSGFTRTPGVSTLLWEGDQLTTWDKYDGLVSALHGLINGGLSGIALNHSDTGGYTSLSVGGVGYDRERELLERWTEMNAFTAVLRTHEGNQPGANAQAYDDASLAHFARMAKVYKALAFYRKQLFEDARTKGWPLVRHLMLHYPGDDESWKVDDEFLLGSEILVAPIKNKCFTWPVCPYDKSTYLPPGRWVHLWSGKVSAGGARVTVKAPIGQPAVFYKEGSPVGARLVAELRAAGVM
jgi:sulfoquinovosidase